MISISSCLEHKIFHISKIFLQIFSNILLHIFTHANLLYIASFINVNVALKT